MIPLVSTNQEYQSNNQNVPDDCIVIPIETLQQLLGSAQNFCNITLNQFLEETFWPDKANLRFLTLRGYHAHVRRFIAPILGDMPLSEINYSAIQQMLNECPTQKAAKDAKGTLSSILGHAVKLQLIPANPALATYILPDRIPPDTPPQGVWLTDFSQIMSVLRIAKEFDPGGEIERACLLGYGFGLRKGEILGVNKPDFRFDSNSLFVLRSYTRGKDGAELHGLKTSTSLRELPFFDYIRYRLYELKITGNGPFVSYDAKRSNPSTIAKRFQAFREQKGLPQITIATMRHSFATAMIREGCSIPVVQQWLGHTSPVTTLNCYVHPSVDDLRADAKLISNTLDKYYRKPIVHYPKVSESDAKKIQCCLRDCDEGNYTLEEMAPYLDPKPTPNREQIIKQLISENPTITKEKIADYLGVSITTTKRIISNMKKANIIRHVGPSKGGYWALCA